MVKPVARSDKNIAFLLVTSALRVGRQRVTINIEKIATRRKSIQVECDPPAWRQYIITGGDA